jgi:hypothetical protein
VSRERSRRVANAKPQLDVRTCSALDFLKKAVPPLVLATSLGTAAFSASAVEIKGTVGSATAATATISIEGDLAPNIGDPVEIFFKMPGVDEEISVGNGKVTAVNADAVEVKIDEATGTVSKDQLAKITSANPQKHSAVATKSRDIAPSAPASEPPSIKQIASDVITFDQLTPGPLSEEAFADRGIHFATGKGAPGVYESEPNMILPPPCKRVLLLANEHVTSFSITFDAPVHRFAVSRIGTSGGASIPTWRMTGYDSNGKVIGATGEEHGLPSRPQYFAVKGAGIVRVELTTDNRHGEGTWATWSSLPVAAFGIDR